ncbi:MAG TPA: ribosome small subunit-dependent GTPase A [Flavobacterium sp.]|nr:ribosome small subunit-dependent GTPase A [Flavobacterium sp.]
MTGIVYKSTGSWYTVKSREGVFYKCKIKGKFRIQGITSTNPVAVGDVVDFELDSTTDEHIGVIKNIHDRHNYIIRKSVNLSKQVHIIGANIDLAFLLVTVNYPLTTTSFIDRFLASAEAYNIKAILIFNKIDTLEETDLDNQLFLQHLYTSIGYKCLRVSALEGIGIEEVKALMKDKTSLFSGHSGVGKSTLVNALEPTLNLKTSQISESNKQGQHTTTFAEMYDLSFGARIIDTPGIRGFGMVDMEPAEVTDYFPEFYKLKAHCRFNNCLHKEEPGCAVKEALDNDQVFWSRYKSYIQILEGDDSIYRLDEHLNQ